MGLWIKGCPKCKGDLYSDRDIMGYYRQCLQCGYTFYEQSRRPVRAVACGPIPPADGDVGPGGPKHTLSEAA
jgi:hypothetical protein